MVSGYYSYRQQLMYISRIYSSESMHRPRDASALMYVSKNSLGYCLSQGVPASELHASTSLYIPAEEETNQ